jgi:hypothetical protein
MRHLDVDRVLAVLGGEGSEGERAHLGECASCRRALDTWQLRMADLRELESNAVESSEMHNLRVVFRQLGPRPEGMRWVARLTHGPELAAEPVRGGLAASLGSYRAGPFEIVILVRPAEMEGRFEIQGQIENVEDAAPRGVSVVVTSRDGYVDRAALDTFGEFRLTNVPAGPSRLVWLVGNSRIDLMELAVGEPDDDARH